MVCDIYFHDEAPRIGCGWRRCIIKIGSVWTVITEKATGKRVRLTTASVICLQVKRAEHSEPPPSL